jgi:hypothetical protein
VTPTPCNAVVPTADGRRDDRPPEQRKGADDARHASYRSHGTSSRDAGRFVVERTEAERFWSKVDRPALGGCWTWLGQTNQWGYGHFRRTLARGQYLTVKAHRFAYELVVAPIPAGLTLDHLCGNQSCVRPEHLEPVTNAENLRRRHARRRANREGPSS